MKQKSIEGIVDLYDDGLVNRLYEPLILENREWV